METEKELNKVLSDIYLDLEKLQSAREQVEIVTQSSKELTLVTATLLKELKGFSNQFGKESSSHISQLSNILNEFESKIGEISEKGNRKMDEQIASFKKQIVSVVELLSQQIANNEKNLNSISNLNSERIAKKIEEFEKVTNEIKIIAEKGIEDIKGVAITKIEIQEQIISKTIAAIEETNLKNKELITIITEYDIPKRLESVDNKLVIQFNQNKIIKQLLIVVLSLIGLGVLVEVGLIAKYLLQT